MDHDNSKRRNSSSKVRRRVCKMSSSAGTKHFYFQTTRKEVNEHDTGAEDHPNNRSFDSVLNTSNMKDQSIQQGDGVIRRPRSNRTTYIGSNRKWTEKYVSPFVLLAEQRARERARQHKLSRAQPQRPAWDDKIAPTGTLFDPTIHKQEIFKLQPRNKAGEPEETRHIERKQRAPPTQNLHVRHQANDAVQFKPNGWSRMTIKTSESVPMQAKRIQERTAASANRQPQHQQAHQVHQYQSSRLQQRQRETGTSPLQSMDAEGMHRSRSGSPADRAHRGPSSHDSLPGNVHSSSADPSTQAPVAVTRSTSPIDQHIVTSILREDGIVNDDDFTVHIKSYQPAARDGYPPTAGAGPNSGPYDGCYDPVYDEPPKDQDYYARMIRHRLRDVLKIHNDASDAEDVEVTDYEDLNTSNETRGRRPNRNDYHGRRYLRSSSHGRSRSASPSRSLSRSALAGGRGATEDLMFSVAQIMSAVGSIVARPPQKKYKSILKRHERRKRREQEQHGSQSYPSQQPPYMAPFEAPNASGSVYPSGLGGYLPHSPTGRRAGTAQFSPQRARPSTTGANRTSTAAPGLLDAAADTPMPVPRSKAEMVDLILAKLQEIELNERQTLELLARCPAPAPASHQLQDYPALHSAAAPGHGGQDGPQAPQERTAHATTRGGAEDSSMAVEAQSELDISLDVAHHRDGTTGEGVTSQTTATATTTTTASKRDSSTQDSPHSLSQLQAHLREQQFQAALGPSLAVLGQQQAHQAAVTEQLTPQQLQERHTAYTRALPPVPRNPESERALYAYMKELDRTRELKDVAFRSRGVSMAQVADRMADEIMSQLLRGVAYELDECMDQYSQKFLDKI